MRLSMAVLPSLLGLVAAQGLNGLPECAKSCATDSIPSVCGLNIQCICTSGGFLTNVSCCVMSSCSLEDQNKTIMFAQSLCASAGVNNMPGSVVCNTTQSSSTPTTSPTPVPSQNAAAKIGVGAGLVLVMAVWGMF
ncbi:hypothetical protein PAAG_00918 [Paracoccidioides lutzii Pb01]|uniref:CFEM domain-containing protein n=1 Tax=Paracoccidioides lutzii (strain ATCC MYA-826 / Pb01) TaxID=502779 RepID=C1GQX3_PARBA|nr:hypothetical protein PAAG_00918 [Paracoccidioides lutzii Pb01]EEH37997.1 hypothetical protein PAAG_00918 [Paracoccidioides lutzii Pb01]